MKFEEAIENERGLFLIYMGEVGDVVPKQGDKVPFRNLQWTVEKVEKFRPDIVGNVSGRFGVQLNPHEHNQTDLPVVDLPTKQEAENYALLRKIGFNDRDAINALHFAERQDMPVPALLRQSLRVYQATVEPRPELPPMGCPTLD